MPVRQLQAPQITCCDALKRVGRPFWRPALHSVSCQTAMSEPAEGPPPATFWGAGGTGACHEPSHICRGSMGEMNVPSSRWT